MPSASQKAFDKWLCLNRFTTFLAKAPKECSFLKLGSRDAQEERRNQLLLRKS